MIPPKDNQVTFFYEEPGIDGLRHVYTCELSFPFNTDIRTYDLIKDRRELRIHNTELDLSNMIGICLQVVSFDLIVDGRRTTEYPNYGDADNWKFFQSKGDDPRIWVMRAYHVYSNSWYLEFTATLDLDTGILVIKPVPVGGVDFIDFKYTIIRRHLPTDVHPRLLELFQKQLSRNEVEVAATACNALGNTVTNTKTFNPDTLTNAEKVIQDAIRSVFVGVDLTTPEWQEFKKTAYEKVDQFCFALKNDGMVLEYLTKFEFVDPEDPDKGFYVQRNCVLRKKKESDG